MWGSVTVGGITLRETVTANQSGESVQIVGQESFPPSPREVVRAAHSSIVSLPGQVVPVVFTDKEELTGFYRVDSADSMMTDEQNATLLTATWSLALTRIGGPRDVETESRVPDIGRQTAHAVAPVFWHAPAGGSTDYFTGSTVPVNSVVRDSVDGPIRAYLGIPATSPRWTAPANGYQKGAARIQFAGIRRLGRITPPGVVWDAHNGIVRVSPGTDGAITVTTWSQLHQEWRSPRTFVLSANAAPLTGTPELTIIRNDPEEVIVRLTYMQSVGRFQVDLSIRRGARFVAGVVKRHAAATLALTATVGATGNVTGGVRQSTADDLGNRYVLGSAMNVTRSSGAISIVGTTLTFFAGHEVGTSPQAGDAFADLLAQYLGSTGEWARVVLR